MTKYLAGYASFGKVIKDDGININGHLDLLSNEQIWGTNTEHQLNVIKEYGAISSVTDLCILTGCRLIDYDNNRVPLDKSLKGRYGFDWTKSSYNNKYISTVVQCNMSSFAYGYETNGAIRPVLNSSYVLFNIYQNKYIGYNNVFEVEFGEYPQFAVDSITHNILELQYKNDLKKTGKYYTFGGAETYLANRYNEYEYNNKKYIRIKANFDSSGTSQSMNLNDEFQLSNGIYYKNGDYVWLEISPVKWLIDEQTGLLISKYGLVSGIKYLKDAEKYNRNVLYDGDFNKTEIKKYFDNFMLHELFQNLSLSYYKDNNIGTVKVLTKGSKEK